MKYASLSYVCSDEFNDPASWLERVKPYVKVLEAIAKHHKVYSFEQINYEGEIKLNGVQYFFIRQKNKRVPLALHRLLKKLVPDVVIVHGLNHPAQIIQLRMQLGDRPTILLQSHAEKLPTGWRRWLQKKADHSVNGYLFTSINMARHWLQKKLIGSETKVKEAMVATSTFHIMDRKLARKQTKVSGHPIFLFVGRLDANKDPLTLVKAFSQFCIEHRDANLYLVFPDEVAPLALVNLINESKARSNFHLTGRIPHAEMQYWYNSADFFVSTSHAEAFGMAASEAMSCGCYPILTNIPSFRKLTANGEFAMLFDPGNVEELTASLKKAMELDLENERMKILQYYQQHLSAEAIANQIYKAVASL